MAQTHVLVTEKNYKSVATVNRLLTTAKGEWTIEKKWRILVNETIKDYEKEKRK